MSAYIVSQSTMNRVIAGFELLDTHDRERFDFPQTSSRIWSVTSMASSKNWQTELGNDLYKMNQKAVLARYPNDDEYAAIPDYRYSHTSVSRVNAVKAMRCLLYQCEESSIPDCDLFQNVWDAMCALALDVVTQSDAYERAPWD